jgi:integrase
VLVGEQEPEHVDFKTAKELLKQQSEIVLLNAMNSLRSEETKKKYAYVLRLFAEYQGLKYGLDELALLIDSQKQNNVRIIETQIINYIVRLRKEDFAYATIMTRVAGIFQFYTMNDIVLNRKKIYKYMGEHIKTVKDRAYTIEEIKKIVDTCNLKFKVVVTLMASSGCRIGAIPGIKLSDLVYITKERMHQIFFYTNTKDEYYSFTTPECSKYINEYLEYRQRSGERLTQQSPLVRNDFQHDDLLKIENPKSVTTHNLKFYMQHIIAKAGLKIIRKQDFQGCKKRIRLQVAANHGLRKFVHTTMANNGVLPEVREMLLGHRIGLSGSYYKPTEKEMLTEYLKVVDQLTINEENRLRRENQQLKTKLEDDFKQFSIQLTEIKKKMGII